MYFAEKLMHQDQTRSEEGKKHREKMVAEFGMDAELIRQTGRDGAGVAHLWLNDRVSETPDMDASWHCYNERFMGVRTPLDDKRGLLTRLAIPATIMFYVLMFFRKWGNTRYIFWGG
ncbi:hypothetical protein N8I74_04070 [Chitiniphilus purpureus]|uniref:Uncharacterized protein n=1 Tax=Chitiniphilus purpureus TaxID=2981137 RepID=A0ABY6DT06_9NEIS|nr:hypothetical protein [Chitiniphilus sp. CD1]UXY16206.1 hypothetical protein N8I74_04070 [Chitiniphilus sp. CD1]